MFDDHSPYNPNDQKLAAEQLVAFADVLLQVAPIFSYRFLKSSNARRYRHLPSTLVTLRLKGLLR